ncbi:MAG: glutathione S-transferase family protein [Xenophilus sp.]
MTQEAPRYTLYGAPGSGAVPIHAALTLTGLPVTTVDIAPWDGEAERERAGRVNPARQVPALVTPEGELLTESAAILIWLGDRHPEAGLAPLPGDRLRAQYLRWMSYIATQIYALFWVRDDPARLAADKAAQDFLLMRSAERLAQCWHIMDGQVRALGPAGRPWLLGERLGLLDLYVAVASRWTPKRRRFYAEAPFMADVVRRVDAEPRLAAFWPQRFPFEPGWEE